MSTLSKHMNWNANQQSNAAVSKASRLSSQTASTEREERLSDEEIYSLIKNAKNGRQIIKLYEGDMSAYQHDHSTAELGLMNYLAFYTHDSEQLDRLYRNSKLCRDKWDEVHSTEGLTYGEITIAKALDDCENMFSFVRTITPTTSRSKFNLVHIRDVLKRQLGIDMLIEGILPSASLACLFGQPASGKSFIALDMAFCIAQGIQWQGLTVEQGAVIYIAGEGINGIAKRVKALADKYQLSDYDDFYLSNGSIDLAENATVQSLLDELKDKKPIKLIVVDTLHRNFTGDENSAKDIAVLVKHADELKEQTGAAILIVHHSGKTGQKSARGSSALKAALDVEMKADKSGNTITMTNTKMKDLDSFDPRYFKLNTRELDECDQQGKPVTSATLEHIDKPPYIKRITISKDQPTLDKLTELIQTNGRVITDKNGFQIDDVAIQIEEHQKMVLKSELYQACKEAISVDAKSTNPDEAKKKKFNRSISALKQGGKIAENNNKQLIVIKAIDTK